MIVESRETFDDRDRHGVRPAADAERRRRRRDDHLRRADTGAARGRRRRPAARRRCGGAVRLPEAAAAGGCAAALRRAASARRSCPAPASCQAAATSVACPGAGGPRLGARRRRARRRLAQAGRAVADERRRSADAQRCPATRCKIGFRSASVISGRADDVRRQQHHDVGLADAVVVVREQLLQDRHMDRAGKSVSALRSSSRSSPASRFDSPSRRRSRVVDLPRSERRHS